MYENYGPTSATAAARTYSSNAAVCDPPVEGASIVRDGLSANEQTLSDIHETISRLEGRLDPALTPVPPQPAAATTTQPVGPPCSHVTARLGALNDGHRHAVQRLRDLIQRVEV